MVKKTIAVIVISLCTSTETTLISGKHCNFSRPHDFLCHWESGESSVHAHSLSYYAAALN